MVTSEQILTAIIGFIIVMFLGVVGVLTIYTGILMGGIIGYVFLVGLGIIMLCIAGLLIKILVTNNDD